MEFIGMSPNFPTIFKGSSLKEATSNGLTSGQTVVCTPEVSLYQYNGNDITKRPPMHNLEEKSTGDDVVEIIGPGSSPGNFQCGFCGKTFQQKNTFQNHLRSHREGEDPYQCDICGKTFAVPARLTRHYRTHTGEKPYQCEYCNKSFSVKENLSVHRRIHTKERPYKCEVCERAFEHSGKLHRHMRIHTGERPHRCQICQKTFIQSGQLVIHMRTHTGEKPYVCKVCNKGFTCSKQLKVHTRTHTGEKPYTCDICGKSFGYNHVLKLHQVAHFGEKVYKCTLCNSTFNSKKSLETHIKTHSSDNSASSPQSQSLGDSSELPASQTPQNSDKENRESSDSDISLQNSPTALESPRSPPSPMYNSPSPQNYKSGVQNVGNYSSNGNNRTQQPNLPYPMLPPGVKISRAPQSRTTFLYVTSKLPTSPSMNNNTTGSTVSPASEPQTRNSVNNSAGNVSFKTFGINTGQIHSISSGVAGMGLSNDVAFSSSRDRDKLFLQSATIRDKVLASIEKFGYGIPNNSSTISDNSNSSSNNSSNDTYNTPMNASSAATYNPSNRSSKFDYLNARERDNSVGDEMSDNLSGQTSKRQFFRSERNDCYYNPYSRPTYSRSGRGSSPDNFGNKYSSGRVLALALTRGSKAVANQLPMSVSLTPVRSGQHSPPLRNTESPAELCIDFSRRSGSVSPRNSVTSPTPSTTSRSTPGLSESAEDLSDEYSSVSHYPRAGPELNKRGKCGLGSFGPRKRSSLILEKYAQEIHPASPIQISTESILAQRLRLSSVIQYAEKCT